MTSRKEWEEYFELINNRKPNADEIAAALEKGEFTDAHAEAAKAEAKVEAELKKDGKEISKGMEETKEQAGEAFNKAKQHAGNYFGWLKNRALHPMKYVNEDKPNQLYLWLTFALTTVLSAGIFWNVIRRIFAVMEDAVRSSYGSSYSSSYTRGIADLAGRVLPSVFFNFVVVFVILFLAALPGLALVSKGKEKFKNLVNKFLVFQPAAAIFAAVGFIYSFIAQVPTENNISNLNSTIQGTMINIGILVALPMLAVAVTNLASIYFVQKYRENDQKIDLIWWQIAQTIITSVVIYIGYALIVTPMFKSLIDTISSFNY